MSVKPHSSGAWLPAVVRLGWVLILLFSLTGCSNLSLFSSPEPVSLKFAYVEGVADYATLAEAFNRDHPNITVELLSISLSGGSGNAQLARLMEGDAVRLPIEAVQDELAQAFLPVDSLISTDRDFPQSDIFPGALEALRLGGKQVGLPAGLNPYVVNYNPMKFTIAGLQPPSPTWTLDDFMLSATSIHDISTPGDPRYTYGLCSMPEVDPVILAYLFGGGLVDNINQPTRPTLDSPANVEALTWYTSLRTDFGIIPAVSSWGELNRLRSSMACGFWLDWMDRAFYTNQSETETMMLPLPAYRSPFAVVNVEGYFILSTTAHPDETYAWLRFLMSQQSASGVLVPPLRSQVQSAEYSGRVSAATLAVAKSLPPETVTLGLEIYRDQRFGQVLELFARAAVQVASGQADPHTALTEAQKAAESSFR